MNKLQHSFAVIMALAALSGCVRSEVVSLPSNVSLTSDSYGQHFINQINFSYASAQPADFAKAKLCVAQNLSNNDVTLKDAVGTHIGAFSGQYYQQNNSQVVSGKDVFKYVDDNAATLIANGTFTPSGMSLIQHIIKYEMTLATRGNNVTLQFSNITRAQQDTGFGANSGFLPVGAWAGAGAQDVYNALQGVANQVKACIG